MTDRYTPGALSVEIEPQLFVIFGGTGDLARKMLLPALYQLLRRREFHDSVEVLAVATREITDEEYRTLAVEALTESGVGEAEQWAEHHLRYQSVGRGYEDLRARIEEIEAEAQLGGNRAFYLAIPPGVFDDTVEGLGKCGAFSGRGWTRVVVEKPFGSDLASSDHLNNVLHAWLDEDQIYRIDHYLAKETVQNLMALRFANPIFESSWTRDRIESVQITVAEDFGIGTRAGYFDKAGIVRDIVQNHALQILSLVAMEPPVKATSEAIRDEKVKVLRATYPADPEDTVRGQYAAGVVGGDKAAAYVDEKGVDDRSTTETYAAIKLQIDNWRWKGVPFYIRTGKRLEQRVTQVSVVFKEPPVFLFSVDGECAMHPNVFDIRLQPSEGFSLSFEMKVPGEGYTLQSQRLRFGYDEAFGELPGAYVTLMADVMTGDQTLFVRSDEVKEAWRIVTPILDPGTAPHTYPAGTWGPAAADELLSRSGHHWQPPGL